MGKNLKPLLINQEGVFFIFRKGVEMMDMEGNKDNEDMGMAKNEFNNFNPPSFLKIYISGFLL